MKKLEITNEIYQNWIDIQLKMVTNWTFSVPFKRSHNEIGKAIFGDNLEQAKNWICKYKYSENKITIENLKQFNSENTMEKKEIFFKKILDQLTLENYTQNEIDYYKNEIEISRAGDNDSFLLLVNNFPFNSAFKKETSIFKNI